jgi:hypothetical protein
MIIIGMLNFLNILNFLFKFPPFPLERSLKIYKFYVEKNGRGNLNRYDMLNC